MSYLATSPQSGQEDIFGIQNVTLLVTDESFTTGCGQTECTTADSNDDD